MPSGGELGNEGFWAAADAEGIPPRRTAGSSSSINELIVFTEVLHFSESAHVF
jgi:hypothetical protein